MSKKRFGDRKDGVLIRDIDAMHLTMVNVMKTRCDSEVCFTEDFDITNINAYLKKKNEGLTEDKYGLFQVIIAIVLKTVILRPQLNRFIANKNFYQRNDVSASFIVKKKFSDTGKEGLAIIKAAPEDNINSIHKKILHHINGVRSREISDSTDSAMELMTRLPRFVVKNFFAIARFLDRHGWLPDNLTYGDPNYSTVLFANLGSIKLPAGYHHLNNWGTCSMMCVVGEKFLKPVFDEKGNATMVPAVSLAFTLDERISDGYYMSKTLHLIRKLFENPELLELPLDSEVEY